MAHQEPDRATWEALYAAAARFFALKPWRWMLDSDVFGVKNPANGEIGWCCIMGAAEEHYALAVYLGTEGLEVLKQIGLREVPTDPFSVLMMQKCLMASFEDRELMEAPDLETIRVLGLNFRARNTWPQFRSYLPGYAPWTLTQDEALFLTLALDQACEVSQQYRARPEELGTQNALNNYETFLVRVPVSAAEHLEWKDATESPPPFEAPLILPSPADVKRAQKLAAKTKRARSVVDMDYFSLPSAIMGEGDERPWYPQVVLCVDDESGMVLHFDMLNRGELGKAFGEAFIELVTRMKQVPGTVQVRTEQALILLEPIAALLDVELKLTDSLPAITEAQQGLLSSL